MNKSSIFLKSIYLRRFIRNDNSLFNSGLFKIRQNIYSFTRNISTSYPRFIDPYSALGVSKNATQEEIKKAYFKKVKEYHPDRNPGKDTTEKFREVQESYEILSKPERRQEYDVHGTTSTSDQAGYGPTPPYAGRGRPRGSTSSKKNPFEGFFNEDFFDDIFGSYNGGREQKFQVQVPLSVTFEESILGCKKEVKIQLLSECSKCNGSGIKPGHVHTTCPSCKGRGNVTSTHGNTIVTSFCNVCGGSGKCNTNPCGECRGSGKTPVQKSVAIPVPPGVENNTAFQMTDDSNIVYVVIKVTESPVFKKIGNDIHSDLFIDFIQAALGGVCNCQTIRGTQTVKIPQGVASHHQIRIPGQGVPTRGNAGDHVFNVHIVTPKELKPEDIQMLTKLKESLGDQLKHKVSDANHKTKFTEKSESSSFSWYPFEEFEKLHPMTKLLFSFALTYTIFIILYLIFH